MSHWFDVFISYRREDILQVERLARLLLALQFRVWLDRWSLIPGDDWQTGILEGMQLSRCFLVCIGREKPDNWCAAEVKLALSLSMSLKDRKFPIIPVLLPEGKEEHMEGFLSSRTFVQFQDSMDDARALHQLTAGLRGEPPGPYPPTCHLPLTDSGMTVLESMRSHFQQPPSVDLQKLFYELRLEVKRLLAAEREQSDEPTRPAEEETPGDWEN